MPTTADLFRQLGIICASTRRLVLYHSLQPLNLIICVAYLSHYYMTLELLSK